MTRNAFRYLSLGLSYCLLPLLGWSAPLAAQGSIPEKPDIEVTATTYFKGGQDWSDYGLTSGKIDITSKVHNDSTQDILVQIDAVLTDGKDNVLTESPGSFVTLIKGTSAQLTTSVTVPDDHEGYHLRVHFYDSAAKKHLVAPSEEFLSQYDLCGVYQYFLRDGRATSGAYLWIPPKTRIVHGILISLHNGLPTPTLEDPGVRQVAEQYDLAEIVLTPNGSEGIHNEFLGGGLFFDFTNPVASARFDSIIKSLADLSGHPELVNSPYIPLAHSAFLDVPFDIAMRDCTKCIAALPIKAGMPDKYAFYKEGGKSHAPAPDHTLENVPILFYQGFIPETAIGSYKSQPLRPLEGSNLEPFARTYRKDTDTNSGESYTPGDDLAGAFVDLCNGHFETFPRDMAIEAMFIKKACQRRLPDKYPTDPTEKPVLKPITLSSGWLIDVNYQNANEPGLAYYPPAPYASYKGPKAAALWFCDEEMARACEQIMTREVHKKVEQFTVKEHDGTPASLAESPLVKFKDNSDWVDRNGLIKFEVVPFDKPFPICTVKTEDHDKDPHAVHVYSTDVMFPGVTELPVSNRPIHCGTLGPPLVPAGDGAFRIKLDHFTTNPGFTTFVSLYKDENDDFAQSMRGIEVKRDPNAQPGLKDQAITFDDIANIDDKTRFVPLHAASNSGLPVEYFVQTGPAVPMGDRLMITQLPETGAYPINVTVAAYQIGQNGFKAAQTVYKTFLISKG